VKRGSLTVVGTGYLVAGQMTPEAVDHCRKADKLFYVVDSVTAVWLGQLNPSAESLAVYYAPGKPRFVTYDEMVERVLNTVRGGERVCFALYGHPGVFVHASHESIRRARQEGFEAKMLPGISAEDCLIADLGFDPGHGCQTFEASRFVVRKRGPDPAVPLILWQIALIGTVDFDPNGTPANKEGLKLLTKTLLKSYPRRHKVTIYEASPFPICEPRIDELPLCDLPNARVTTSSTLYVPPAEEAPVRRRIMSRIASKGL
jgi:Tetrapyrrole (Corrin/Porphyrin) Methylases